MSILQWLAHYFERWTLIFRQFIEEEHAIMRQRDLSRMRIRTTSDECRIGDRVVRRTERTLHDQWATGTFLFVCQTYNRMDLSRFQCFFKCQRRQYCRNTLGNHWFTGSGRANHNHIMSPCSSNLHSATHLELSAYVRKNPRQSGRLTRQTVSAYLPS